VTGTSEVQVPDGTVVGDAFTSALKKAFAIAFGIPESIFETFTAEVTGPGRLLSVKTEKPGPGRLLSATTKVDFVIDLVGQPDITAEKAHILATTPAELTASAKTELCAVHIADCNKVLVGQPGYQEGTTTISPCAPVTTKWVDPCTVVPTPAPAPPPTTNNPCAPVINRKEEQTSKVHNLQRVAIVTPMAFAVLGFLMAAVLLGLVVRGFRVRRMSQVATYKPITSRGYIQSPVAEPEDNEDDETEEHLLSPA
jgi:hypothetical protein